MDLAVPLDIDRVVAVHHDLGDVVVAEQLLEGPVAEDIVDDLLDDSRAVPA